MAENTPPPLALDGFALAATGFRVMGVDHFVAADEDGTALNPLAAGAFGLAAALLFCCR
jgi:hypothetical protein